MNRNLKIAALVCLAGIAVLKIRPWHEVRKSFSPFPAAKTETSIPGNSSLPTSNSVTASNSQAPIVPRGSAPAISVTPVVIRNAAAQTTQTSAQRAAQENAVFGGHGSVTLESIPLGRFRSELEALDPVVRQNALTQLSELKIPRQDVGSLHADSEGSLLYSCPSPASPSPSPSSTRVNTTPSASVKNTDSTSARTTHKVEGSFDSSLNGTGASMTETSSSMSAAYSVAPAASSVATNVPISSPPPLHSKLGATNIIYLNFRGQVVSGTAWNLHHAARYPCQPFDIDHDLKTFNPSEQQLIIDIWERVSEHYRPFNVDVTTVKPASLANNRVATALITRNFDTNGVSLPDAEAGGVAYLNKFGNKDFAKKYSPAFIFFDNLSTNPSYIAEAAAHEIGHNLGLTHDGLVADGWASAQEYYRGHGSGAISWAPVMGDSYGKSVSQWSQGEYFDANNPQDQVGIIAGKLSFRTDYGSNTITTAIPLSTNGIMLSGAGVIVRNNDVDYYSFSNSYPQIQLSVSPVRPAEMPWNDPLDLAVDLLDSNGTVISHFDSPLRTDVDATIPLPQGNYYMRVFGSGAGSPMSNSPTGYTTYGSLGSYNVNLTQKPYLPPQIFPGFGDNTTLTVTPGGLQPYSFSWSRDGVAIPGVTDGALTLTNIQQSDGGVYGVTVTDGLGNTSHCNSWVIPRHDNTTLISTGNNAPVIPASASNVVSMSARSSVSAILNADSTVTVLGDNSFGQTNVPTGLTNVIAVSAADAHVLALKSDGTVIGWGDNRRGQIDIPIGLSNVVAIAAGGGVPRSPGYSGITSYSLALKDDGTVVAWGNDDYGQTDVPRGLSNVVAIAAGNSHSLALIEDGSVAAWGGHNTDYGVANVPAGLSNVVSVAADGEVSLALKSDGTVVTWGQHTNVPAGLTNAVGIAQAGNTGTALLNDGMVINWDVFQTNIPSSFYSMVDVQAGTGFLLGLQDPFLNIAPQITLQPQQLTIDDNQSTSLSVMAIGSQPLNYQWRRNGIPISGATSQTYTTPKLHHADSGVVFDVIVSNPVASVSSAGAIITVNPAYISIDQGPRINFGVGQNVTLSGSTWGLEGSPTYQWTFNNHPIVGATNATLILNNLQYCNGGYYALHVTDALDPSIHAAGTFLVPFPSSSSVVGWGSSWKGLTNIPSNLTNAIAISTTYNSALALKSDGADVVWGESLFGQTSIPSDIANVVSVVAGNNYSLALQSDGSVSIYTTSSFISKTLPPGLTNVIALACGASHNIALKSDGTVLAWGDNSYGQTNVPSGLINVVAIAAGNNNCMAVKDDGSVVTWGANTASQPYGPPGLSNVVSVAAGDAHFLALKDDGTVAAWGYWLWSATNVPVGLSNVVAVAAGDNYSLALKNNGTVSFWGDRMPGYTNVITSGNGNMVPPEGLTNVVAITAKLYNSFALINTSQGTPSPSPTPSSSPATNSSPTHPSPTYSQSITLPSPASRPYSSDHFWINASSSSGLPVALSVLSGPAAISGNKVSLTGVGTVVIAANQSGNWSYLPAPQVTNSFAVTQASQSISFSPVASLSTLATPFSLYATASSGLPVSFTSSAPSVLSISGNTATINGWGSAIITATQGGNFGYAAARPVSQTVVVAVPQTITPFTTIPTVTYAPKKKVTIILPTASSGQPVTVSVKSGPATISGNIVTLTGRGTVVLVANQIGNSQYLPAPQVTTSLTVK